MIEKNKLGEKLLSDGEVLDIIYDWMYKIKRLSQTREEWELARDMLKFLRDNEPMKEDV
jgi:hypothetical protein